MSPSESSGALSKRARWVARGLANRLRDFAEEAPQGFDLDAVPPADIALYFADAPSKLYQLRQWLPVFEQHPSLRTIVVVRHIETYDALQGQTSLQVLLLPNYDELMAMYDRASFHAVIYVNNGWTNFQSLAFQQAVHIHVNHGESDKICMVSNQAKAYDCVFVAGEAAVKRHAAALAWFDPSTLIRVGRPQLDLDVPVPLPAHDGPTITYAPTWEGEDDANNYTSLDKYGVTIIEAALAQPGARVVYKPHPRAGKHGGAVLAAHEAVVARIRKAQAADPAAGHAYLPDADILGVIRATDVMIADVSSVTLDHLYLRPQAPILLTDRRSDRVLLMTDAPVSQASHIVDAASIATLADDLAAVLVNDPDADARARIRDYYFDGLGPGESTTRFWDELTGAITRHDESLRMLSRVRVASDGPASGNTASSDSAEDTEGNA